MPDWTFPVDIVAQTIGNLAVDIAAQTIGNLTVDIAAQSLATLNVNIESIGAGVVFNVAQSGTWTINAVQSGAWTINIGAPLDESGNLATSIQSSVQLDVNIAASVVTLNVNIESISSGVVFNVAQSGDWTINAVQSGTWTINIGAPLDASGYVQTHIMDSVQLDVNIAASAVTLNVNIASQTAALDVWLTGSEITLDVNIASQTAVLNVNIESQTTTIDVNIASSVTLNVTGSVTITSGTVNVQTSGGANIVIDKLTQNAYTERREWLTNNGTAATMTASNNTFMRGKFFPRGCRGYLAYIMVYCDNQDTLDHELTVYISPVPGMGAVQTRTYTVPAGSSATWFFVPFYAMWNYDSMFVWVRSDSDTYIRIGYDTDPPHDAYYSTDGAVWSEEQRRYWIRASMLGMTVGDLPVSGTVNTIEVPASASRVESGVISVPDGTVTDIATLRGAGTLLEAYLVFYATDPPDAFTVYGIYVYVDGELIGAWSNQDLTLSETATEGAVRIGEFRQYSAGSIIRLWIQLKFKRELRIAAYQTTGSSVNVEGHILANTIS